jgi:hypothetical protein
VTDFKIPKAKLEPIVHRVVDVDSLDDKTAAVLAELADLDREFPASKYGAIIICEDEAEGNHILEAVRTDRKDI